MNEQYAYVDVPEYYADQLFIKYRIPVEFGDEYAHPDHGYRIIFCSCRKWHTKRFCTAMDELFDVMRQNGHTDYEAFCEKYVDHLKRTQD